MVRKTKEEAAATRKALLDAALIVFSQKGYAGARLEDVAEHAGVSRGAIYWHFHSKAELYNTLVEETSAQTEEVIRRGITESTSVLDANRRIMIGLLVLIEEDDTYRAVQELVLFKTEITPELEEGIKIKAKALRATEARIAAAMQRGIDAGAIRADLDPVICARAALTYFNGIIFTWLIDQQAFSLRKDAPALVNIFIGGIATHSA